MKVYVNRGDSRALSLQIANEPEQNSVFYAIKDYNGYPSFIYSLQAEELFQITTLGGMTSAMIGNVKTTFKSYNVDNTVIGVMDSVRCLGVKMVFNWLDYSPASAAFSISVTSANR